jgi:hypothetical protein
MPSKKKSQDFFKFLNREKKIKFENKSNAKQKKNHKR